MTTQTKANATLEEYLSYMVLFGQELTPQLESTLAVIYNVSEFLVAYKFNELVK